MIEWPARRERKVHYPKVFISAMSGCSDRVITNESQQLQVASVFEDDEPVNRLAVSMIVPRAHDEVVGDPLRKSHNGLVRQQEDGMVELNVTPVHHDGGGTATPPC